MKWVLVFIIVAVSIQLFVFQIVHDETIDSDLNLSELQAKYDLDAGTASSGADSEEVYFPYGINLDKYTHENKDLSRHTKYTFTQNGKEVDVIEDYDISDIYDGDMDKDGVREMIFKTYSGGVHCCSDLYIARFTREMKKPLKIPLNNLDAIKFKDLDGDGIQEWIMYDDQYSYFLTCFACSPYVKIVATYKEGKLILRPKLTKKHMADDLEKLSAARISLSERGYLHVTQAFTPVMNHFLYHFYSGDTDKALGVIDQYLIFEGRGVKLLFLKALFESMSESYFWDQLRKINRLYEVNGFDGSLEYYDADTVSAYLFEKLELLKSKRDKSTHEKEK
ncbi:hypothetical protein MNB_SV-4-165 [hydrothermal vent metagenome]|uniref:Uncharacterized protein n=1 Tax=hydrothermal vent metagenome TaxID=652676 RepID=A0A1W1EAW6_9ZZZZ